MADDAGMAQPWPGDRPPWMTEAATQVVVAALQDAGAVVRYVGGCVRDALLGRPVADIDLATPVPPDGVMAALARAGLRVIPTGIAHGTVTAVVGGPDGRPRHFEITTLRRDLATDGRHAEVGFTSDWRADAARRDFTMNALSAEPGGLLYDYFGGLADARAGRVRFIGDPQQRVREDYLRILRFFRFFAHYGRPPADPAALEACRSLAPGIDRLSGERLRTELLRLLAAPDPVPAWQAMVDSGVARQVIGQAGAAADLAALVRLERMVPAVPADPLRRLAVLFAGDARTAEALARRLRLSGPERDRLVALRAGADLFAADLDPAALTVRLYRLGQPRVVDLILLAWAAAPEDQRYRALLDRALAWTAPEFPLRGRDALAQGVPPGLQVGTLLAAVEEWWIAGGFAADRDACLAELVRRWGEQS